MIAGLKSLRVVLSQGTRPIAQRLSGAQTCGTSQVVRLAPLYNGGGKGKDQDRRDDYYGDREDQQSFQYSSRGPTRCGRAGGQGDAKGGGHQCNFYVGPTQAEVEASDETFTGIIIVCQQLALAFLDLGSTFSYVFVYFDITSGGLGAPSMYGSSLVV